MCPEKTHFLKKIKILFFQTNFKTDLNQKLFFLFGFVYTNGSEGARPSKNMQILLQILSPVSNTEIWAPELVGEQNEMVV